jgi:hypothetical protein
MLSSNKMICQISPFRSGAVEVFPLLGCYTAYIGSWLPSNYQPHIVQNPGEANASRTILILSSYAYRFIPTMGTIGLNILHVSTANYSHPQGATCVAVMFNVVYTLPYTSSLTDFMERNPS